VWCFAPTPLDGSLEASQRRASRSSWGDTGIELKGEKVASGSASVTPLRLSASAVQSLSCGVGALFAQPGPLGTPAVLQTVMAHGRALAPTCDDTRALDQPLRHIPRMSHDANWARLDRPGNLGVSPGSAICFLLVTAAECAEPGSPHWKSSECRIQRAGRRGRCRT
jgi:hypothetical protein